MTWSNGYGRSDKQIPRITKIFTLYPREQSENPTVPKLFTTVIQGQSQI